jgi:hypothetical protein
MRFVGAAGAVTGVFANLEALMWMRPGSDEPHQSAAVFVRTIARQAVLARGGSRL